MAWGVNSVLSMGVGALFTSQANIQTTGNNISNVDTPGYSRQAVRQEARRSLDHRAGQVGQGVEAKEVIRYFDAFVESSYLDKLGMSQRYEAQYSQLRYVENIFNESNSKGLSNSLTELFKAWNKLSQQPDSLPTREALLATANTLATSVRNAEETLEQVEQKVNSMIRQDVDTANQLIKEIAELNKEISNSYLAGRNNPNTLMDQRDEKVRQLGSIIDVKVEDRGPGAYNVSMKNGYTLVQDTIPFSLEVRGVQAENNLTQHSPYKGTNSEGSPKSVHFLGNDSREYTLEMVTGGIIGTGAPQFKVSVDGGKTWLSDDSGNPILYNANAEERSVRVGELDIHFDEGEIAAGDRFIISPKQDVYWVSPTSGPINISPQIYGDGSDNGLRMTGGSLAGLLEFRDYQIGEYRDQLDAIAKGIIWEVNRIHSSGAGLEPRTSMSGTYGVGRVNEALGTPEANFTWSDRLSKGNMSFEIYRADGSVAVPYPGLNVFSALPGGNFDPAVHSLQDVATAINNAELPDGTKPFKAEIINGKLHMSTIDPDHSFAITADSSGLAAALGMNTFFDGDSAETFAVREGLSTNPNFINAGRVNGAGEMNPGDNATATDIAKLANTAVSIGTFWNKQTSQSLIDHYSTLVTKIGSDTSSVRFTAANESTMALDLYQRQQEISGVSLDEEMSSLIKFQASYKAAAKLITTADEMLQTLLSLKQ